MQCVLWILVVWLVGHIWLNLTRLWPASFLSANKTWHDRWQPQHIKTNTKTLFHHSTPTQRRGNNTILSIDLEVERRYFVLCNWEQCSWTLYYIMWSSFILVKLRAVWYFCTDLCLYDNRHWAGLLLLAAPARQSITKPGPATPLITATLAQHAYKRSCAWSKWFFDFPEFSARRKCYM